MNPYVFVFGCPRSGTTVVHRLLDANSSLCMLPGEQNWIAEYSELTWEKKINDEMSWDLMSHLMEVEEAALQWMKRYDSQIREMLVEGVPFREFIIRLFDFYGKMQGKEKTGNKNPKIGFYFRPLSDLWPSAKFVHIIRDGRDVSLSVNAWRKLPKIKKRFVGWDNDPVMFAALWWRWQVITSQAVSILGPERYYEIRYEALVQNPSKESAKLCHFLSIPYDDSMVRFHEGRTREEGRDAKHKWLPVTQGLRDWRNQMTADDVENFEIVAGDLLHTLNYPRVCDSFSQEKLEKAKTIQELFQNKIFG